jgi:hypothetical protein
VRECERDREREKERESVCEREGEREIPKLFQSKEDVTQCLHSFLETSELI